MLLCCLYCICRTSLKTISAKYIECNIKLFGVSGGLTNAVDSDQN